jgi:putative Ca2+/H+ antiporter (TMEM165/GDT1 family)
VTGLKGKRLAWTIVFLGVTLAAIVMECVAGLLHPAGTIPWTEYLARYVPWPIQLVAYVTLAVWLPFHFWRHDHMRKIAYKQGHVDGRSDAYSEIERIASRAALDLAPRLDHAYASGYNAALERYSITEVDGR